MARILVVDDEASARTTLEAALTDQGYAVTVAASGEAAFDAFSADPFDLVITDLRMNAMTGIDLLRKVRKLDPGTAVIVVTAYGSIETAVEAMRAGAISYLTKPLNLDEVALVVERTLKHVQQERENAQLRDNFQDRYGLHRVLGTSPVMKEICRKLVKVSASDATVLLAGESGTGKGLIARAVHHSSPRKNRSFVEINCAGLPEPLLESELFGHARGAFTDAKVARKGLIEEANEGTFFLDEIGDASLAIQSKLLKVLEDGELRRVGENSPRPVNVRFIAATNKDLKKEVDSGNFREDLFFRLHVVAIHLPSLRARRDDIRLLAEHFLGDLVRRAGKPVRQISDAAHEVLENYAWPGNIRELRNVLEHAVIMAEGDVIDESDLPAFLRASHGGNGDGASGDFGDLSLSELERRHIERLLEKKPDLGTVAKILGIGRTTLWRKMKEYGLQK